MYALSLQMAISSHSYAAMAAALPPLLPPRYLVSVGPRVERSLVVYALHGVLLHGKGAEMGLAHDAGAGFLQSEDHVRGCVPLGIRLEKRPGCWGRSWSRGCGSCP